MAGLSPGGWRLPDAGFWSVRGSRPRSSSQPKHWALLGDAGKGSRAPPCALAWTGRTRADTRRAGPIWPVARVARRDTRREVRPHQPAAPNRPRPASILLSRPSGTAADRGYLPLHPASGGCRSAPPGGGPPCRGRPYEQLHLLPRRRPHRPEDPPRRVRPCGRHRPAVQLRRAAQLRTHRSRRPREVRDVQLRPRLEDLPWREPRPALLPVLAHRTTPRSPTSGCVQN